MTILLIIIAVMSMITLLLYAVDKRRAINGAWRIPEMALLLCSLLGGAIGGYLAMFICHHKTRKWYFHLVNIAGLVLIAVLLILVAKNVITMT